MAVEFIELTGRFASHYIDGPSRLIIEYVPGGLSNAIGFIEPLQWIPTNARSRASRLYDELVEVYGTMIMRVKTRMDAGEDVQDCLVKTLLLDQEREKLDWEDLCMLAAVFVMGPGPGRMYSV